MKFLRSRGQQVSCLQCAQHIEGAARATVAHDVPMPSNGFGKRGWS